jgi:hypothetical protein
MSRYTLLLQAVLLLSLCGLLCCYMTSASEENHAVDLITVQRARKQASTDERITGEEVLLETVSKPL